ncbi:MAG: SDR family oxidoreductase [Chitinophagaceae bacterium]|nr:SDR family oxidoreductase [Chitinophagaceae bacterium]
MNLNEAKVLITGGSSGLGYETAKQLLAKGAMVIINGRNKTNLEKAAKELGAVSMAGDVSKEEDVMRMIETTIKTFGSFNVLINNAAFGHFELLVNMNTEKMRQLYETNVLGAMMVARESARHFIEKQYGTIVNVSSTAGRAGFSGGTAYASTKFALSGMTECWRAELRQHNIRVMQVNPSEVQTNFGPNAGRPPKLYNATKLQSPDIAHTIVSMLEMDDRAFITEATVWATHPKD